MRHEYCEKNGVMITYSDEDVAFEEIDSAKATVCYFPFPASVLSNRISRMICLTLRSVRPVLRAMPAGFSLSIASLINSLVYFLE